MANFDEGGVFFAEVDNDTALSRDPTTTPAVVSLKYKEFLRNFRLDENRVYRDMLRSSVGLKTYLLEVDIDHLMMFDDKLANELLKRPSFHLPRFEQAALEAAVQMAFLTEEEAAEPQAAIQVTLTSSKQPLSIRKMLASQVSRVVTIPGILTSASRIKAKGTCIVAQCASCKNLLKINVRAGFAAAQLPRVCSRERQPNEEPCPLDPYAILPEKCSYVDMQTWKLQEAPEMVPTGEMPRSVLLTVDRRLVDRATPGQRITVTGIMSILNQQTKGDSKVAIRQPYLQVLGVRHGFEARTAEGESLSEFSQEEEERFVALSREPDVAERLAASVAPSIFGDGPTAGMLKKAIACLLFSGSRKELADGARLRGDINVLLLGDPSIGKSQYLKFVEKCAPICVYTSGKGSSAAGLTATVSQEAGTRDFYLEGGAMVIADGGVVCIDEFDKMREQDRVAIHEAMEQQTISIAKAGITTVLNSRTAVLAAANPTFGSYQDEKNAAEQVDFQTTILSRFDMIFVLKDKPTTDHDTRLAQHIIDVHRRGGATGGGSVSAAARTDDTDDSAEIDVRTLKRYIAYCRKTCHPRLEEEAAAALSSFYVQTRQELAKLDAEMARDGKAPRAVPITVRQLEAIVRISESLAKMRLSDVATTADVQAAIELFKCSTLQAAKMGEITLEGTEMSGDAQTAMAAIRSQIPIGGTRSVADLVATIVKTGVERSVTQKAIQVLVGMREFEYHKRGERIKRVGGARR